MITIKRLDHLVLTVNSLQDTIAWYTTVLGMAVVTFGDGRYALTYGQQKINLHLCGHEFEPKAMTPTSGSADLCFIVEGLLPDTIQHLKHCNIPIIEGPVSRTGATGAIHSVYVRDPDSNLIELSVYS